MPKKPAVLEIVKTFLAPLVTFILCIVGAWATTQGRVASLETQMKTVNDRGTASSQNDKNQSFIQLMQIQKSLSTMEQAQKDMKEDLTDIKQRLNARK